MLKKIRIGSLIAAVLLCGCDHHQKPAPAGEGSSAPVAQNSDSDLTGIPSTNAPPTYPRATLVTLPPGTNAAPVNPAKTKRVEEASAVAATPPPAESAPPLTPPAESTPPPATPPVAENSSPAPVASSPDAVATTHDTPPVETSTPPPAETAPASDPVAAADPPRLTMTSQSPVAASPPPASSDNVAESKVVVLSTSYGSIVIELDPTAAPKTCENFIKLVSEGFYDRTTFHRVIPNFIIQGGDPNSKSEDRAMHGQGGPGYTVPAEIDLKHTRGAVAMARLPDSVNPTRDSNGSQFYICLTACPSLDGQYTVFGHVIKGMDVVAAISSLPRDKKDNPVGRIQMEARLETKAQALH